MPVIEGDARAKVHSKRWNGKMYKVWDHYKDGRKEWDMIKWSAENNVAEKPK